MSSKTYISVADIFPAPQKQCQLTTQQTKLLSVSFKLLSSPERGNPASDGSTFLVYEWGPVMDASNYG